MGTQDDQFFYIYDDYTDDGRRRSPGCGESPQNPPVFYQGSWYIKALPAPGYPLTGQALEAAKVRGRAAGMSNFHLYDENGKFHDTGHDFVSVRVAPPAPLVAPAAPPPDDEDEWVDC